MNQLKSLSRSEGITSHDLIIELLSEGITRRLFEDQSRPAPSHLMTRNGYVHENSLTQQPIMSHHSSNNAQGNSRGQNQNNNSRQKNSFHNNNNRNPNNSRNNNNFNRNNFQGHNSQRYNQPQQQRNSHNNNFNNGQGRFLNGKGNFQNNNSVNNSKVTVVDDDVSYTIDIDKFKS